MKKIKTWIEADKVLKEMCDIQRDITCCENELNNKIDKLKHDANNKLVSLVEKKELLMEAIEEFTLKNKKEFEKVKSKELMFGTVGFRKSTSIIIKNISKTIEQLKKLKMVDCLKITETVNKTTLSKYKDDVLNKVDVAREFKEDFYCKLKKEEAIK